MYENLQRRIEKSGSIDIPGTHHEFASKKHGRKIDMDNIKTGSILYNYWMDCMSGYLNVRERPEQLFVVGVANGANRIASSVAAQSKNTTALHTIKANDDIYPTELCTEFIESYNPAFLYVVDDVGTTGSSAAKVCRYLFELGVEEIEVVTTWQRQKYMPFLDELGVSYSGLINKVMPTFSPEDCSYCIDGEQLITR